MASGQVAVGHHGRAGKAVDGLFGCGALFGIVERGVDFLRPVDQEPQFRRVHGVDDVRADPVAGVGIVPFKDRRPQSHACKGHFRADGMVGKPHHRLGKRGFQVGHPLQGHNLGRAGVKVGAFQKRIVDPGGIQNGDRGADGVDRLHARGQDHWLALPCDVADQRQIVSLARADLVGRHIQRFQKVGGGARKRRGNPDHPQRFSIALQLCLFIEGQRTAFHHMPDRHIGIGREDVLGLFRHLVFDDVGLMLDHLAARTRRQPHHILGNGKAAAVVDADLGDDKGRVVRADFAVGDLHGVAPWLAPSVLHDRPAPVKPGAISVWQAGPAGRGFRAGPGLRGGRPEAWSKARGLGAGVRRRPSQGRKARRWRHRANGQAAPAR